MMHPELASWVISRVKDWRDYRDQNYSEKWKEYYRLWRGIWDQADKLRDSERSRLISPASQQAVEATVAELEEATFGRDIWFDLRDDVADEEKRDIEGVRDVLKEDLEKAGWPAAISESMLNGALYGNGIGELVVEEIEELVPSEQLVEGTTLMARGVTSKSYICVKLNPISPLNFCSDPGIRNLDEGLGCAIDDLVARHIIIKGMNDGIYENVDLGDWGRTSELTPSGESKSIPSKDKIRITRYYGKVPASYLEEDSETEAKASGVKQLAGEDQPTTDVEDDLVEAIVIIANDSEAIKAIKSPHMMQDRPVVAYAHDTVPGRFHGRGVMEKGYNAQKALDTELRARADGLALTTHPMMGIDASRLPRGMKPKVVPGMTVLTNGNPKDILMPFNFGNMNPVSYKESAELERMVTMATGAMDSAAPMGVNARNNTASGMSMMMGASIKRHKRTLKNFQDNFLVPAVKKALHRMMQFSPERYPVMDFKFRASSTLGIMAREYEQQQFIQLLSVTPPESPVWMVILQSIYENSAMENRAEMLGALDQMKQQMAQPKQPDPAAMGQVAVQQKQVEVQAEKNANDYQIKQAELQIKIKELAIKEMELQLKSKEIDLQNMNNQAEAALKEMDRHANTALEVRKQDIEARNDAQDNATNAIEARLQSIEKAGVVVPMTKPVKKNIKLVREKGELVGATVEEVA